MGCVSAPEEISVLLGHCSCAGMTYKTMTLLMTGASAGKTMIEAHV